MTIPKFKAELKPLGLTTRKQRGLEVLEVSKDGTALFTVTYAELHPITNVFDILAKKLRPEYIPPLG